MSTKIISRLTLLPLLAAVALLTACSKQSEPAGHDDHAGHGHGKAAGAWRRRRQVAEGPKCTAHGAPKSLCFICDASLRDKGRLWCNEHSRYEDRCWECHPEAQDKNRPYCKEHFALRGRVLPLPPRTQSQRHGAQARPAGPVLMCTEHNVPEAECGICQPELAATLKPGEGDQGAAARHGLGRASPACRRRSRPWATIADAVECYAELTFNQNKLAQIAAPVGGIIQEVRRGPGQQGGGKADAWRKSGPPPSRKPWPKRC